MKIILVDDHSLFRHCLAELLRASAHEIIAECNDVEQTRHALEQHLIDMLILDYHMPGDVIKLVADCRIKYPKVKIIIATGTSNPLELKRVLNSDVDALVLKESSLEELESAIKYVSLGRKYISSAVKNYTNKSEIELTSREVDVLSLILKGLKRSQIAEQLFVSVETIKTHRKNIMAKFKAKDSGDLIQKATDYGYIGKSTDNE